MTGPALSNYLCHLADRIGERAARHKRASREAVEAALAAGRMLVEARAECRHGGWLAFLRRAGVADRTARHWMKLAGSGLDVAEVLDAGGVRAALLTLANPTAVQRIERQVDEAELPEPSDIGHVADLPGPADTPGEPPNPPETKGFAAPAPAERRAVAHESAFAGPEPRSVQADGLTLYQWRRNRGLCTACGAPAPGKARCSGCAEALNRVRRTRTRIAGELVARIEAAAASGDGLTLTPADVVRLASAPRRRIP